eukprot:g3144.t1
MRSVALCASSFCAGLGAYAYADYRPMLDASSLESSARRFANDPNCESLRWIPSRRQNFLADKAIEGDLYWNKASKKVEGVLYLGKDTEGYPGLVHGGLSATLGDQCMGIACMKHRKGGPFFGGGPAFTANLNVDYRRKIPTGSLVEIESAVEREEGRKMHARFEIREAAATTSSSSESKRVFVEGRAIFIQK